MATGFISGSVENRENSGTQQVFGHAKPDAETGCRKASIEKASIKPRPAP